MGPADPWPRPARPQLQETRIRTHPRRVLLPLALATALALSACGGSTDAAPAGGAAPAGDGAPVRVAASTDVYGSIVQAVGGDRVEVTSFIDNPGADPGAYESAPADAVAVERAQLVIGNGGGYDDFLFRLTDAAGGQRTVLDVTELSGLEAQVAAGEEVNEHLWFDLAVVQRLADRVAELLTQVQPDGAAQFTAAAQAFRGDVEGLRTRLAGIRKDHPGARVAATEPLPLYLVRDAGLVNATPEAFMQASEEGTDAPAAVVQQTLELVSGPTPVRAVLLNTQTQTPATDRLRQATAAAKVPEVEVYETLTEGEDAYVPWMRGQVEALARALEQTA